MKITLDPSTPERIFTPYLEITYREKLTSMIHDSTSTPVSFVMDYYQEMDKFWN
jgi:hypothetical protein